MWQLRCVACGEAGGKETLPLSTLTLTRTNGLEIGVDLAWRGAKNEGYDSVSCYADVGERAEYVDLGVGDYEACAASILNSEFGPPIFACDAPNSTRQMVAVQRLHILDLKAVDEEVIYSQERNGIIRLEAERESLDKVSPLLQHADVWCVL